MLKKADITELKSMAAPPELFFTVIGATMRLLGYSQAESKRRAGIKKVLVGANFMEECEELTKDKIPDEVKAEVREILKDESAERTKCVCSALTGVFVWVKSMVE